MNTNNFQNLIQLVTGRDFSIITTDIDLTPETEYRIYRRLPIKGGVAGFTWKTPKTDEKMLRSFITAFSSKYREPNPASYNYTYGGKVYTWNEKTEEEREFCYCHHATHMYSKDMLLKQIEDNFSKESIANGLIKYGFYPTEYGVGIFCFWMTAAVNTAIVAMATHLKTLSIPFTNEFSDAKWVYRFKLGISKDIHTNILQQFN